MERELEQEMNKVKEVTDKGVVDLVIEKETERIKKITDQGVVDLMIQKNV